MARYSARFPGPTPRWHKPDVAKRGRERFDRGRATRGPRREVLDCGHSELERGHDLGRGDGTWQGEHAVLTAALDDGGRKTWRDHELGTGGHCLVDLRHGEYGACADEDVAAGGHRADRVLRGGGAEGHLRDPQAAGDERTGQPVGVGGIIEHHHRNET